MVASPQAEMSFGSGPRHELPKGVQILKRVSGKAKFVYLSEDRYGCMRIIKLGETIFNRLLRILTCFAKATQVHFPSCYMAREARRAASSRINRYLYKLRY